MTLADPKIHKTDTIDRVVDDWQALFERWRTMDTYALQVECDGYEQAALVEGDPDQYWRIRIEAITNLRAGAPL